MDYIFLTKTPGSVKCLIAIMKAKHEGGAQASVPICPLSRHWGYLYVVSSDLYANDCRNHRLQCRHESYEISRSSLIKHRGTSFETHSTLRLPMARIPTWIVYASAAVLAEYLVVKILQLVDVKAKLREKVRKKRQEAARFKSLLDQHLAVDGQLLTESRRAIVNLSFTELRQKLQDGSLTCVQVLQAFQAKALQVTRETNCITEFIKEAEDWAKALDKSPTKGPLHGIPISVKDSVALIGYDSTLGVAQLLNKPADKDSALVAALKSLGAIPFCKTNVPLAALSYGCSNSVWGLTSHPLHKDRTPGGSSGGEGCLIGAGGSPLGVGSDIGGSLRVPAAFCGISTLRPTAYRLSSKNFSGGIVGVPAVPGLMARDFETVLFVHRLLLDNSYCNRFDPDILPIPWNEQRFSTTRKLRIGYYEDDGYFPPTPGVRRAVQEARFLLEKMGHELVPFNPPRVEYVLSSFFRFVYTHHGKALSMGLLLEDVDPALSQLHNAIRTPYILERLNYLWMSVKAPRFRPLSSVGAHDMRLSHQLKDELVNKDEYAKEFKAIWRKLNLDLCIAPPYACPAPLSKDMGYMNAPGSYAMLYNFLDFPVGIVPVTQENKMDQTQLEDYCYNDAACSLVKESTKGATGLPLAVQVVGLPYQEELVLLGMQILNDALKC